MKRLNFANGQVVEILTLKEIKEYIEDGYINNKECLTDDFSLYIKYKDGSEYCLIGQEEDGKYKRTGIETVIEGNPETMSVYGKYKIAKDREEDSDEECIWRAEAI